MKFHFLRNVGPPTHSTLTASYGRVESSLNGTLKCQVNGLDHQQLHIYRWQWKFQDREIYENEKYKMSDSHGPLNFCQQSKGSAVLHINNVSKEDMGQYICVLLLHNLTLAEREIPFYTFGKLLIYVSYAVYSISIFACRFR